MSNKILEKNNYRESFGCCFGCKHSHQDIKTTAIYCKLTGGLKGNGYSYCQVRRYSTCDKFER